LFAASGPNPGSDSQPKSGRRKFRRNLSPDVQPKSGQDSSSSSSCLVQLKIASDAPRLLGFAT